MMQYADPRSKTFASDTYAALTRDMWGNYLRNFMPFENDLIQYATDPEVVNNAMGTAQFNVQQSFQAQRDANERRLRGFGVALDADEQRAADRSFGLSQSIAEVNAMNMAGQQTRDRQRAVIGNPSPSIQMGGA